MESEGRETIETIFKTFFSVSHALLFYRVFRKMALCKNGVIRGGLDDKKNKNPPHPHIKATNLYIDNFVLFKNIKFNAYFILMN